MNVKSESILTAIDILVNKNIENLRFDKTIEATIVDITNAENGEYQIQYQDQKMAAYSKDLYSIGDIVYVMIPEGDFSNTKIIYSSDNFTPTYTDSYEKIIKENSPSFEQIYETSFLEDGYAMASKGESDSLDILANLGESSNFSFYAKNAGYIQLKASFKTAFNYVPQKGNYGLRLSVETIYQGNTDIDYTIDINSFLGQPYDLRDWSPQEIIFSFPIGTIKQIKKLTLFKEGFDIDAGAAQNDIFVKDISIKFVEPITLTGIPYYLDILTPNGSVFTEKDTELLLKARLFSNGKDILSESTCECFWFKRNLSIITGAEGYNKEAGPGWEAVQASDFGELRVTDKTILDYKLVVHYNDTTVLQAQEKLSDGTAANSYYIEAFIENNHVKLKLSSKETINDSLLTTWYYQLATGSYNQLSKEKIVDITNYIIHSPLTFYCEIRDNDEKLLATVEYLYNKNELSNDVVVTYEGGGAELYDANGDMDAIDAARNRIIKVVPAWADGVPENYLIEWYAPDGEQITTDIKNNLSNSMFEKLWIDLDNNLCYTVRKRYNQRYNKNTIQVKLIISETRQYLFSKEVLFLKNGDQGTNGTSYYAAIRPVDQSILFPITKFNTTEVISSPILTCDVYKDGELQEIDWKALVINAYNCKIEKDNINKCFKVVELDGLPSETPPYIKATIPIDNREISALYPINTALDSVEGEITSSIPQYIKYSASGIDPQYNRETLSLKIDEELCVLKSYSSLLSIINGKLSVPSVYPNGNFVGVIGDSNSQIFVPVILYINTYGNEAINGWDGTSVSGVYELDTNENATEGRTYYNRIIDQNGSVSYEKTSQPYSPSTYYYQTAIFAPQVGAGKKNEYNAFSGVLMGTLATDNKTGLYGYNQGVNTFGLDVNGQAYFGLPGKGQIKLDGTNGVLTAGGWKIQDGRLETDGSWTEEGETINYYVALNSQPSGGIVFQAGPSANTRNFIIYGDGSINANYGRIGGWSIDYNYLSSGNTTLHSTKGITTNTVNISNGNENIGFLGRIDGNDGSGSTDTIGINSSSNSIVLQSGINVRTTASEDIYLDFGKEFYIRQNGVDILKVTGDGKIITSTGTGFPAVFQ